MSNTTTTENAAGATSPAEKPTPMKLTRHGGMILAPLPDEYTGDTDTLLCTCNEHGEAVVPREAGEALDRCLYDLRNTNTEAGKLPDGTTVELDGRIVGHFNGCHFIPAHDKTLDL